MYKKHYFVVKEGDGGKKRRNVYFLLLLNRLNLENTHQYTQLIKQKEKVFMKFFLVKLSNVAPIMTFVLKRDWNSIVLPFMTKIIIAMKIK